MKQQVCNELFENLKAHVRYLESEQSTRTLNMPFYKAGLEEARSTLGIILGGMQRRGKYSKKKNQGCWKDFSKRQQEEIINFDEQLSNFFEPLDEGEWAYTTVRQPGWSDKATRVQEALLRR